MSNAFVLASDTAELTLELAHVAQDLGIDALPEVIEEQADLVAYAQKERVGILLSIVPSAHTLLAMAAARKSSTPLALGIVSDADDAPAALALAGELGMIAVDEVKPMGAVLALLAAGAQRPWTASTKGLSSVDRARLRFALDAEKKSHGKLVRADAGKLGYTRSGDDASVVLGEPRDVAVALLAFEAAEPDEVAPKRAPSGVDSREVLDVIFGPPRALSDPASKAALRPYGVPMPVEELCASPSRAAAEASRIGYPVRIALASPDLRVWDHGDLAVDGVDNAARVRDVFRQLMTLAETRQPHARLLGVTVTATTSPEALLRVRATPLGDKRVHALIGFADAHGAAAHDETVIVLPAPAARVERALSRLVGSSLIFQSTNTIQRASVVAITDVLDRVASFMLERAEVEEVELYPMALLMGGNVEVREACVHVGDAFLRSLDAPTQTQKRSIG